jgi:hypothetical protein
MRPDNLDALPFADTADQDPDALPFGTSDAYPNGRCGACGNGLDDRGSCYTRDCSRFDPESPDVIPDEDGTSGQDRESYTDEQDRDSYTVDEQAESPAGPHLYRADWYGGRRCWCCQAVKP